MDAIISALAMRNNRNLADVTYDMSMALRRLNEFQIFSLQELSEFSGYSPYRVKQAVGEVEIPVHKTGVHSSQLDHLIRMVDNKEFAMKHIASLIKGGATYAGMARVTGESETTLRRWEREAKNVRGN